MSSILKTKLPLLFQKNLHDFLSLDYAYIPFSGIFAVIDRVQAGEAFILSLFPFQNYFQFTLSLLSLLFLPHASST